MIEFGSEICTNFDEASSREWLETNGIGGFASGTIAGANTRRYHALLTPATRPPLGRITTLSKFEETIVVGDTRIELSSNRYPGTIHPRGFEQLRRFRLDPFPIWEYEAGGLLIEKRVFMPHRKNAVVCRWRIKNGGAIGGRPVRLELRPLLSFVDYHHLQHQNAEFDTGFTAGDGSVTVRPYADMPELCFAHNGASVKATGSWYRNFEYAIEAERGFDHHEDLYQPFVLSFGLSEPADVIVSTERVNASQAAELEKSELARREKVIELAEAENEFEARLALAADQFIVDRGEGKTVIAGYPWFSDWGRDTMISLPGLTLAAGRHDIARSIIAEFANYISDGMLPNRFPDAGDEAEYNTVDATLWYFEAVRAYLEATNDEDFVRDELYAKLADIVAWHVRGTRYNIHADTDGLLYAGDATVQLTWMDAKIGDQVITPRTGKAVEIQALWYNALKTMSDLAGLFGHEEDRKRFESMADLARQNFNGSFWNAEAGCLYDVVENGTRDASIRPNQIFAISLHYPILDKERWAAVVETVERKLRTPFGLRSLAADDPQYVAVYKGSPYDRDSAYHQGTVWGWLIGPFIDAYVRVHEGEDGLTERVRDLLSGFELHLREVGVGQVSEIFDADSPHAPRGCPAQAWSIAELLRVAKEHL